MSSLSSASAYTLPNLSVTFLDVRTVRGRQMFAEHVENQTNQPILRAETVQQENTLSDVAAESLLFLQQQPELQLTHSDILRDQQDLSESSIQLHTQFDQQDQSFEFAEQSSANSAVQVQRRRRGRPRVRPIRTTPPRKMVCLDKESRVRLRKDYEDYALTYAQLASRFGVCKNTVRRVIDLKEDHDEEFEIYRKKKRSRITPEISAFIVNELQKDPTITGKKLSEKIAAEKQVVLGDAAINLHIRSSLMKDHGFPTFSVKRLDVRETVRNCLETKRKRLVVIEALNHYKNQGFQIVYIDETGFDEYNYKRVGRSPVGEPCIVYQSRKFFRRINAITAISTGLGVVHCTFVSGSVSAELFCSFLRDLHIKLMANSQMQCVLLLDNAPIHKTAEVISCINGMNHIVLFNAPYSCEMNPIEYVFGVWKNKLRIPVNVSLSNELMVYLAKSLSELVSLNEINRSIHHVETTVWPKAQAGLDLLKKLHLFLRDCITLSLKVILGSSRLGLQ